MNIHLRKFSNELSDMLKSSDAFWGYGSTMFYKKEYAWGNTGIKEDLYKYGVMGVFVVILGFYLLVSSVKTNKSTKYLVFLIFLMFYYNGDVKYSLYINIPILCILTYYNLQVDAKGRTLEQISKV